MILTPKCLCVLTNPFIWRGNVSVVQITTCMESILRRLWALHKSQKGLQCVFFAQVRGSQTRQRRFERQCAN
jgi:hypothetical protein